MNIKHANLHSHDISLVNPGKPVLIILGDQNIPELIDDGENMVIILRIVDASPAYSERPDPDPKGFQEQILYEARVDSTGFYDPCLSI